MREVTILPLIVENTRTEKLVFGTTFLFWDPGWRSRESARLPPG